MERAIHRVYTPAGAMIRHLVIGHSQIHGCWDCKFEGNELNFNIDWICVPGGKAKDLLELMKQQMSKSQIPLRISAIIWQNSIPDLSFGDVEQMIEEIEATLDIHPQHKVALPECQFVPAQARMFEHIAKINLILADFNGRQGFNRYPLFRATMKQSKNGYKVKQAEWSEFQNKTGPGYHIADKTKLTKFIRKFHAYNLENAKFVQWRPSTLDITKVLAVISPPDNMIDPSEAPKDLREKLRDNKQGNNNSQPGTRKGKRSYVTEKEEELIDAHINENIFKPETSKRKRSSTSEKEEEAEQAPPQKQKPNTDEDEEILVTFQNDGVGLKQTAKKVTPLQASSKASSSKKTSNNDGSSTLINWLKEGNDQGYMQEFIKSFEETMKDKIVRKLKKKRNNKRRHVKTSRKHKKRKRKSKKEESSESSSSDSSTNSSDSSSSED